jgi:prepilin-type N-terminal cleavage/methylation domain-containing protein
MKRGYSLVEIIVVIAIVGILASIVGVTVSNVREKNRINKLLSFDEQVRAQMSDSLIAEYLFDEGSGTEVKDNYKYNDGVIYGDPNMVDCKTDGQCLQLDSDTATDSNSVDHFRVGSLNYNDHFQNKDYTWSFWLMGRKSLSTSSLNMPIIGFGSGSWPRVGLRMRNDNSLLFNTIRNGSALESVECGDTPEDKWAHIMISASYSNNFIKCYRDGELLDIDEYVEDINLNRWLGVGHSSGVSSWKEGFTGYVDNMRFYREAYTQ